MIKKAIICPLFFILNMAFAASDVTLREKVGQMLIVNVPAMSADKANMQNILRHIQRGHLGGYMIGTLNVQSPSQLKEFTSAINNAAKNQNVPLLISIDQEGGIVSRLASKKGFKKYDKPIDIANKNDEQYAKNHWQNMACDLKTYGINMNFAPVVDLNINETSPAIGKYGRAFSKDSAEVVRWSKIFIDAHRKCGIVTSLKHFPGHGSALGDTHEGYVDVTATWQPEELVPYTDLNKMGYIDTIMVAHIVHKNWRYEPASLSKYVINDLIKNELNYDGIIISDDLMMGAIKDNYSLEKVIEKSINAGSDIMLFVFADGEEDHVETIHNIVMDLLAEGKISEKSIDKAYGRIINFKKSKLMLDK